jgi:hypothetical protein
VSIITWRADLASEEAHTTSPHMSHLDPETAAAANFYDHHYTGADPIFLEPGCKIMLGSSAHPRTCRFDPDQGFHRRAHRAPGDEKGQAAIAELASDQQPPYPQAQPSRPAGILGIEIRQFQLSPAIQARPLGLVTR